ncbi:membrane-tethered transcription factor [Grosmannia clavigera kw1407]|uniref:Membrane-tethered transcription factor n=1 Tax=Grosmannia clavigera (strain kw1407 / UAMH 11150) TaxID=655863 RepID=F0XTN9_GROCL|nr:membrane-tethered transcription factor [Grosmannia clavigera kw1407]EFW98486.1 membrane-tethered transcription factor [Grosmannia clavigera kw1407]
MSAQDGSFEALAASPGDFAVDSEWMGDSPPALTVDFMQNPHSLLHHVNDLAGPLAKKRNRPIANGAGGTPGGKDPLMLGHRPAAAAGLSQPPTASSPDSLLSSFQDSSSDISSKQTSMSAHSSLVSGTPAKKTRGRPRGAGRAYGTDASGRSAGGQSRRAMQPDVHLPTAADDVVMAEGTFDAAALEVVDAAPPDWNIRDYLRLDEDQDDNDDDGDLETSYLHQHKAMANGHHTGTIDPKSIQRTPSLSTADELFGDDTIRHASTTGADLSPFSGNRASPFDFMSPSSSPNADDPQVLSFSTPQMYAGVGASNGDQSVQRGHNKALSQYSLNQSMNNLKTTGSREVSPISNFVFSQGPSPTTYLNNAHSPAENTDMRFGQFAGTGMQSIPIASGFMFPESVPTSPASPWQGIAIQQQQQQQQQQQRNAANGSVSQTSMFHRGQPAAAAAAGLANHQRRPLRFFVGVTPHKSRVETQIPIMIFLSALPPGVTKLHLPPHTISKPKLLAKDPIDRSPDMLELHTMVVCTSAMHNENNRRRALERAAAATYTSRSSPMNEGDSNDDDDCRPANGGDIWICKGCIQRERKRANRKKLKKPEDDEEWSRDEHRRIVIFNTNETKDWQRPTAAALSSLDENAAGSPIEAVISVPMRITCYCRHHGEKTGFQVIFTLKDFQGNVIAQTMSRSIMITDDHKTPTGPNTGAVSATAPSSVADGDISAGTGDGQETAGKTAPAASASSTKPSSRIKAQPSTAAQSAPDLPSMKRNSVTFSGAQSPEKDMAPEAASEIAMGARALSRAASPNGLKGHSSKKRKANGGPTKIPTGLAMTRIETSVSPQQSNLQSFQNASNFRASASSASSAVPFSTGASSFLSPTSNFAPDSMAAAVDMALMTGNSGDPDIDSLVGMVPMATDSLVGGPLTPNSHTDQQGAMANGARSASFDSLAMAQNVLFSAPASTQPSRPPSPNGLSGGPMHMFRQHIYQQRLQQQLDQAQFTQQFQNGLFNLPMAMSQPAASPASHNSVIHKIIPAEGPKSGGIEVTILGSAFYQGLDVMFGNQRATTTTFWGESSLVCLVPPSSIAGHVQVTLRQPNQQRPSQPFSANQQRVTFKYLDDDEQQLLRAALTVLSRKMTGKIEDAQDVARRIIGSETTTWGTSSGGGSSAGGGGGGNPTGYAAGLMASGSSPNLEAQLLKVLELIDLDDSSNQTRLNMQRRTTGHSMLHLACVLGLHRFVAGLLARGANPDVRDNGGYTPLHLAALNDQAGIVRRLIHAGADPTIRTLSGLTAAEVAASREVVRAIKLFERHTRSRSGGSLHSRTSSAASLRSLWEPMTMSVLDRAWNATEKSTGDAADNSSQAEVDSSSYAASGDDEESSEQEEGDEEWLDMKRDSPRRGPSIHSRRGTRDVSPTALTPSSVATAAGASDVPAALASPAAAAVIAFKEQLTAQFQQLVAQIPQIPNNPLPDYYQAYLNSTAFQRISSLVPNMSGSTGSRPNSSDARGHGNGHRNRHGNGHGNGHGNITPGHKELEGRWWDLSALRAGLAPPPSYEEIFPRKGETDTKQATAAAAAAEAEADSKCEVLYDQQQTEAEEAAGEEAVTEFEPAEFGATLPALLQIGRKHQITKEQQENFRRVHKEKRKGLRSDTLLYTVWIPMLIGVLLLWFSGARAWDFFPSVTFNVPYATSLGPVLQPTGGNAARANTFNGGRQDKAVLDSPPTAQVADQVGGENVLEAVRAIVA